MKLIIGLIGSVDDNKVTSVNHSYVSFVEKCGALPIILPYVTSEDMLEEFAALCDGFVFMGGVDVDPIHYGEEKKEKCGTVHKYRDELELAFFKKAIATDKPIIGICRGAQLINVALGGTLYQDLPSEVGGDIMHSQKEPPTEPTHGVNLTYGTPLMELLGKKRIFVNSTHHQAVKTLGKGLSLMARADDGVFESAYLEGERYLRVYQWHPEKLFDGCEESRIILDDFIKACARERA